MAERAPSAVAAPATTQATPTSDDRQAAQELWNSVKEQVRPRLPAQAFATWIEPWQALRFTGDALLIQAPSGFHLEWLELHYADLLTETAQECAGRPVRLETSMLAGPFRTPIVGTPIVGESPVGHETLPEGETRAALPEAGAREEQTSVPSGASAGASAGAMLDLNERYTFSRFVVGSNAQLAAAAAKAVAQRPALSYNPLFLYGGVGLGKTHLMHAIGNRVSAQSANRVSVRYISSERFVNEVISSIQRGTMAQLRRRYRKIEVLLVDDVHFLAGKERTQEEFFHTFNALYDARHQIVLTSDRPPNEIPELEARLVSRFEMGLVVDVKPPDYETRMAILRMKALEDGLTLDDEVISYIAKACTTSVRHLEGAVIKLLALSSLTHRDVDLALARSALPIDSHPDDTGTLSATPKNISLVVAQHFGVTPEQMVSRTRKKKVVEARQIAMYLIKELAAESLARIGAHFGNRDHSTVIHSVRKVRDRAVSDPAFALMLKSVATEVKGDIHN